MENQKLPPRDINAEEAVIGSLLIDGQAIYKITTFLRPPDFFSENNLWIYEACLTLSQRSEAINQITVAHELDRAGKLEQCGGTAYLSHVVSICPTSLDIEYYARLVYRSSVMRSLVKAADQIAAIGYQDDPDVDASLSRAEDVLFRLRHGQSQRDLVHIRHVLDKYFESVPAQATSPPQPSAQVLSGFAGLDELFTGFQPSDLIIIAGRPSMGKTSIALSIARNAAVEQRACVAIFSLEMAREPLVMRLLSSESGVDLRRVPLGHHSEDEEKRIMDATGVLSEAPIYIDDTPQLRLVEMRSKARRLYHEHGLNLVILDHLGLMQTEGRVENRVQEISLITRSLKALARELNVPVIAVSQLSRASEWRASHVPQLSDLRDSGSIEQDADMVLFIYRDEYYYKKEEWQTLHPDEAYPEGLADIIIAKHRNGPTGQIKLRFRHKLAKFENITTGELSLP